MPNREKLSVEDIESQLIGSQMIDRVMPIIMYYSNLKGNKTAALMLMGIAIGNCLESGFGEEQIRLIVQGILIEGKRYV